MQFLATLGRRNTWMQAFVAKAQRIKVGAPQTNKLRYLAYMRQPYELNKTNSPIDKQKKNHVYCTFLIFPPPLPSSMLKLIQLFEVTVLLAPEAVRGP